MAAVVAAVAAAGRKNKRGTWGVRARHHSHRERGHGALAAYLAVGLGKAAEAGLCASALRVANCMGIEVEVPCRATVCELTNQPTNYSN